MLNRRKFIVTAAAVGTAAIAGAQEERPAIKVDGGLAPLQSKIRPDRAERIVPPGSFGVKNFYGHCTGCQLCVAACPNNVLKPSTDLEHLLKPQMGYADGWCRPECTACSGVCPAGAIRPVSREEKTAIKIGTAKVNPELCLAAKGEENCGNCAAHCPTGALKLVKDEASGHRRPVVCEEQCIGCGACEFLCPVRPLSAITVDGLSTHQNK